MVSAITSTTTAPTVSAATTASGLSGDFTTFLKMLTTQMKNQDPLNPVNSSDYAVQLATFSSVEQQTKTNQLLEGLTGQFGVLGMSQLAGWVGQEARSAAPVYYGGNPVSITYSAATTADKAVLTVNDGNGNLVAREEVPKGATAYQWYGGDAQGNPLPNGMYSLSLESYSGDTLLGSSQVQAYSKILEARGGANGATLVLQGGIEVPATEITALRVP